MTAPREHCDSEVRGPGRCGEHPAACGEHPAAGNTRPGAYELSLSDEQTFVPVDRDWLFEIATSALREEHVERAEVSFALVDDAVIRQINCRFLNHDDATDVISFPLHEDSFPLHGDGGHRDATKVIEGEIVISGETAARVAAELSRPASEEIALYAVHGLLHLCGFDDREDVDRQFMQQRQQWHLKKFGIQPHS
jgi:probable rRNA maturation factor